MKAWGAVMSIDTCADTCMGMCMDRHMDMPARRARPTSYVAIHPPAFVCACVRAGVRACDARSIPITKVNWQDDGLLCLLLRARWLEFGPLTCVGFLATSQTLCTVFGNAKRLSQFP